MLTRNVEYIMAEVNTIVETYGERDPFHLAKAMGILVLENGMGTSANACKGFFMCQSHCRLVAVNSDLPEIEQKIVLAHELGHAVLHEKDVTMLRAFHDFSLYEESNQYEYEANLFAAELLLEDDTVTSLLNEDDFFFGVAKKLCVPPEFLDYKFRMLKKKGWALESPILPKGDFLKHLSEGNS